jgi:hypothetical protein
VGTKKPELTGSFEVVTLSYKQKKASTELADAS